MCINICICSFIQGDFLALSLRPQNIELIGQILCARNISSDSRFSLVIVKRLQTRPRTPKVPQNIGIEIEDTCTYTYTEWNHSDFGVCGHSII